MKVINPKNFFPTVCIIYTVLSLGKILLEWIALRQFSNLQLDFLEMFIVRRVPAQSYKSPNRSL